MEPNKKIRFATCWLKVVAATSAAICATVGAGAAQVSQTNAPLKLRTDYLGYSAGVSARVTYSDNINLQNGAGKNDDIILSTGLSGGAIISKKRVTAIILGDLDFSYISDQSDFVVNQRIGATSTFTAADNWLYFDLSGSSTRQLVGDNARFSGNINAGRGQRANVHSYVASPYVYHELGNQSTVEMRYRFSQAFVGDSNTRLNFLSGTAGNDSTSHEVLASYQSGALLDTVRFRLTAYGTDTTEDAPLPFPDFGYQQGSVNLDAQFALSRQFALSGAIGYDEVETQGASSLFFSDDALSGVTWRAGFTAQPGPRSQIRFEYGERYGDDFIDADASYQLTKRLFLTANASRSFRTRSQSVATGFRTTQIQTLDFADKLRQGDELSPRNVINSANFVARGLNGFSAQTTGVAVSDSVRVSVRGSFGRSLVTIDGTYRDDDFGFRQSNTLGAGIRLRRTLSRRMNGYGNLDVRRADTTVDTATCEANPLIFGFDPTDPLFDAVADCAVLAASNGETTTVIGRIGGSYSIFKNVSAFLEVSHAERFSENVGLEYGENTVMVGVSLDLQ